MYTLCDVPAVCSVALISVPVRVRSVRRLLLPAVWVCVARLLGTSLCAPLWALRLAWCLLLFLELLHGRGAALLSHVALTTHRRGRVTRASPISLVINRPFPPGLCFPINRFRSLGLSAPFDAGTLPYRRTLVLLVSILGGFMPVPLPWTGGPAPEGGFISITFCCHLTAFGVGSSAVLPARIHFFTRVPVATLAFIDVCGSMRVLDWCLHWVSLCSGWCSFSSAYSVLCAFSLLFPFPVPVSRFRPLTDLRRCILSFRPFASFPSLSVPNPYKSP